MALGVTYQRPEDDRHSYSEQYLHARIIGAMGGRVAEELVFGTRTTGAENDMQQATELARQMVTRWGMSARLGPVSLSQRDGSFPGAADSLAFGGAKPYSEATAQAIDEEVRRLLEEAAAEASRLLDVHRRELDALAAALLELETLDEAGIRRATGLISVPHVTPLPSRAAFTGL
jgi:cell division protease FtsH